MTTLFFYIIYIIISCLVIQQVGQACYKGGQIFVKALFPLDFEFSTSTNNNLRLAYYCVNIGYLFYHLNQIIPITNYGNGLEFLTSRLGTNLIMIGSLHFINVISLLIYYKLKKQNHYEQH